MSARDEAGDRTEELPGMREGSEAIDAVPIDVAAVAGRATLTVGELSALAPGSIVPLGRSPAGTIELLANGVEFARGRLVELDGELAVELTELRGGSVPARSAGS